MKTKTELYYHGDSITIECKDVKLLSLFLFHLSNSLFESESNYRADGYSGMADADASLRASIRSCVNEINDLVAE